MDVRAKALLLLAMTPPVFAVSNGAVASSEISEGLKPKRSLALSVENPPELSRRMKAVSDTRMNGGFALQAFKPGWVLAAGNTSNRLARAPSVRASKSREQVDTERQQSKAVGDIFKKIRRHTIPMTAFFESPEAGIQDAQKRLQQFRTELDNLITFEIVEATKNTFNPSMVRHIERANAWIVVAETSLANISQELANSQTSPKGKILAQVKLLHIREKLRYLQKLFPNSEKARSANAVADRLVAQTGDLDGLLQQANAREVTRKEQTYLPDPVKRDQVLERDFARAFKNSSFAQRKFPGSQVLKVHLTSRNWSVKRNELTGIILSRKQQADLAIKAADGRCYLAMELFEQKHLGGGRYGSSALITGSEQEMRCENVPE